MLVRDRLETEKPLEGQFFLNGVCRHEPSPMPRTAQAIFLNGVCRHELLIYAQA